MIDEVRVKIEKTFMFALFEGFNRFGEKGRSSC